MFKFMHHCSSQISCLVLIFCSISCEQVPNEISNNGSNSTLETDLVEKLLVVNSEGSLSSLIGEVDSSSIEPNASLNDISKDSQTEQNILEDFLSPSDTSSEVAFRDLERSAFNYQDNIERLRQISLTKDEKIALLEQENTALMDTINALKQTNEQLKLQAELKTFSNDRNSISNQINELKGKLEDKAEIMSDLEEKSIFIDDVLEQEITLSPNPQSTQINPPPYTTTQPSDFDETTLQFEAVVTSLNGKSKEAFYTEFFILEKDLDAVLFDVIDLSSYTQISSFGELWARSRKNPFSYPNVLKTIRNALFEEVNAGRGFRVRTDINGYASVSKLSIGDYFVVGTASLGKVGVTWNVPVKLKDDSNKISLTLSNSSWSL